MADVIPSNLRDEFIGYMDAHNDDDLSHGAWFAMLEQAAHDFMRKHKLVRGGKDGNDGAHFYLELKQPKFILTPKD